MEPINDAVRNALHFISLIQDVCDKKRACLEQMKAEEYKVYVSNWKQVVKSSEKNIKVIEPISLKLEKIEEELLPEEEEALAMADSILEKARVVRSKNKVSLCKKVDVVKNHKLKAEMSVITSSKHEYLFKIRKECKLTGKVSSHMKNFNNISISQKTSVVAHSKLMLSVSNNLHKNHEGQTKKINAENGDYFFPESESACASSLCTSIKKLNVEKRKLENESSLINCCPSDSSKCFIARRSNFPTIKAFMNGLKSKLDSQGHFLSKTILWYPYLTIKSQDCFFKGVKYDSFDNFHKAYLIIHRIQETMLYIELLCLIGKEVLPTILNFEGNNMNKLRLCSYMKSIFHHRFQRIPTLVPNR